MPYDMGYSVSRNWVSIQGSTMYIGLASIGQMIHVISNDTQIPLIADGQLITVTALTAINGTVTLVSNADDGGTPPNLLQGRMLLSASTLTLDVDTKYVTLRWSDDQQAWCEIGRNF